MLTIVNWANLSCPKLKKAIFLKKYRYNGPR